ncbi:MAG: 30S ribosomal protein S21 [Candidatus Babeliales bacterium]
MSKRKPNVQVQVTSDNIERTIRKFKKMLEREGVTRDIKRGVYFEPVTQKKRKRLMRAIKLNYIRMANQHLI